MTFQFLAAHADEWPITWMCGALEVSASGCYARVDRPDRPTDEWRQERVSAIEEIHAEVKGRYGGPRMTAELKAREYERSGNTVATLRSEHGIRAKARRQLVRTTDSNHRLPVAENLRARNFDPSGPNETWAADITYIPTWEGWLYLAAAEDLFSRRIVGWSMAESMDSRMVVDALEMAVARRHPGEGRAAHSDRGTPYASDHDQRVLAAGIVCSMSDAGQCWDHAPVEAFEGAGRRTRQQPALDEPVVGSDTTGVTACPWALLELARFCQEYHARTGGPAPCPTAPSPSPPAPDHTGPGRTPVEGPAGPPVGGTPPAPRPDARRPSRRTRHIGGGDA